MPDAIELRREGAASLYLQALQRFTYGDHPRFPGDRKVNTREYAYAIAADEKLGVALWSWEWNPASEVAPYPHMHIDRGSPGGAGRGKLHVPSGRRVSDPLCKGGISRHFLGQTIAGSSRPGKYISNALRASFQPWVPVPAVPPRVVVMSFAMSRSSFKAASSSGKWPLVFEAFRIW